MIPNAHVAKKANLVPTVHVVSQANGRLRIKVPGRLGDRTYFDQTSSALLNARGVKRVEASALTGSLLIFHDLTTEEILDFGVRHALFVREPTQTPLLKPATGQRRERAHLRSIGGDLSGLAGITLLGLAAAQASRGKFLPAGLTLVFQASEFLRSWHLRPLPSHLEPLSEGL